MRKLIYTVVLGCTSILLLPHAAMAGSLDPVKEMEYQKPDNVIVDVAPIDPGTPVDTGIIKDLDSGIKIDKGVSVDDILSGGGIKYNPDLSIGELIPDGALTEYDKIIGSDEVYAGEGDYSCKNISCADMGYSQQSIINCSSYVFCPFDVSYKACVNYKESLQDSCPANAVCEEKYRVTGCESGYIKDPLTGSCIKDPTSCTPKDCSGYDLTSIPENASYDTCTPGCGDTKPRYKVLSCNSGYVTSISSCGRNPTNGSWKLSGSGACKKCTVSCNSGYTNSGNSCEPSNVCESRAKELGIPNYPMGQGTGGAPTQANFFSTMSCPCSGSANYCSVSSSSHCVNLTTTYGSKTYNCALMLPSGANNGQCKGYNTMMATSVRTLEELANRISSMKVLYMSMEAGGVASANGTATGRICLETQ